MDRLLAVLAKPRLPSIRREKVPAGHFLLHLLPSASQPVPSELQIPMPTTPTLAVELATWIPSGLYMKEGGGD